VPSRVCLGISNGTPPPEPQSWVRVGASHLAGSAAALAEALKGLALTWTPRLLVVLAAPHHNLEAVARELALQLPQTEVIGCTTAGEIAGGRALSDALVLWALGGTGVRVQTGHGLGTGPELREAAQRAASCLETLERRAHTAMILLSDGLDWAAIRWKWCGGPMTPPASTCP
jgi:hypothetical protein